MRSCTTRRFFIAERPSGYAKEQRAQSRHVLATRRGLYSCCSFTTRRLVLAKLRAVRAGRRATHFCGPVVAQDGEFAKLRAVRAGRRATHSCGPVVAQDKGRKVNQASFPKSDI